MADLIKQINVGGTIYDIYDSSALHGTITKDNHYNPVTDSDAKLTANASGASASWSIDVVKGITINRDSKGHITDVSVTSGKIPANPNTDTKVTQTNSSDSTEHNILFSTSISANSTTAKTEGVLKNANLTYVPSTGNLKVVQINGVTVGDAPKFTDTVYTLSKATTGALGGIIAAGTQESAITPTVTDTDANRRYGVIVDKNGKAYVNVPWTDNNTNTWRSINVNGTEQLGGATSTGAANFKSGTHITVGYNEGITFTHNSPGQTTATNETVTSTGNYALNTEYSVVTGVKIIKDSLGHVTGVQTTKQKIKDTDTKYSGTQGITLSGTTFKHTNSITAQNDFALKKIKYDAQGHITGTEDVTASDITPLISNATTQIAALQSTIAEIQSELNDPDSNELTTILDDLQAILASTNKVTVLTGVKYTAPALSVSNDGVLSLSSGSVTNTGTASVIKSRSYTNPTNPSNS